MFKNSKEIRMAVADGDGRVWAVKARPRGTPEALSGF